MRIDLDAAKAARREARGEGPTVVFGAKEFTLDAEVPFEVTEHLAEGRITQAVNLLLGEAHEDFMASKPSVEDLMTLFEQLTTAYGLESLGNGQASAES
jgi:hypothetical protein